MRSGPGRRTVAALRRCWSDYGLTSGRLALFTPMNRSRRESNPHLRFRKPLFYPLNYGNNDIFDFRFQIADCKPGTASGICILQAWRALAMCSG